MKESNTLLEQLKELKTSNSNLVIYLVSLLFAIELNSIWLIIVFSGLFSLSLFIRLNKKYKFITIKLPEE